MKTFIIKIICVLGIIVFGPILLVLFILGHVFTFLGELFSNVVAFVMSNILGTY